MNYRRPLFVTLILTLLISLALHTQPAQSQAASPLPNLDIILVIDESGSMKTSDPQLLRHVGANLFIDLLGTDQTGAIQQLALIKFSSNVNLLDKLTLLGDKNNRMTLRDHLDTDNTNPGNTNIPKALKAASDLLDQNSRSNSKKAIIFVSDGMCVLDNMTAEKSNEVCNQQLREQLSLEIWKYPIYVIAMNEANKKDDKFIFYKNIWQEVASNTGGLYLEPEPTSTSLLETYIKVYKSLLGLPSQAREAQVVYPKTVTLNVPPGVLEAKFTVLKDGDGILTTLTDPNNKIVTSNTAGATISNIGRNDSYSIKAPTAGDWLVTLSGPGSANVILITIPKTIYNVNRLLPARQHPAGKPMDMIVQVVDNKNAVQTVTGLKADVSLAGKKLATLNFTPISGGRYTARLTDTSLVGTYAFSFTSTPSATDSSSVQQDLVVDVVKSNWLKVTAPAEGAIVVPGTPINLQAQLMLGDQTRTQLEPGYTMTPVARLYDGSGAKTAPATLVGPDARGLYAISFDTTGLLAGGYRLTLTTTVAAPTGDAVTDVTDINLVLQKPTDTPTFTPSPTFTKTTVVVIPTTVTPTFTRTNTKSPTLTPTPTVDICKVEPERCAPPSPGAIAALVLGLLALLGGGGAGFWWWSKPALSGTLVTNDFPYLLGGKSSMYIGNDPKLKLRVDDPDLLAKQVELRPVGDRKNARVDLRALDLSRPVRVNGMETTYHQLADKDEFEVGGQKFIYEAPFSAANQADWNLDQNA